MVRELKASRETEPLSTGLRGRTGQRSGTAPALLRGNRCPTRLLTVIHALPGKLSVEQFGPHRVKNFLAAVAETICLYGIVNALIALNWTFNCIILNLKHSDSVHSCLVIACSFQHVEGRVYVIDRFNTGRAGVMIDGRECQLRSSQGC